MRISELREYSQRDAARAPAARQVSSALVPTAAAAAALTRRSYTNGLAMTETGPTRNENNRWNGLNGLGELVQVVT